MTNRRDAYDLDPCPDFKAAERRRLKEEIKRELKEESNKNKKR